MSFMSAGTRASFMENGRPSWSSFDALFKSREKPDVATPTSKLTGHQAFYLFVIHGLCAMVISAAINFAIAYGSSPFLILYQAGPASSHGSETHACTKLTKLSS